MKINWNTFTQHFLQIIMELLFVFKNSSEIVMIYTYHLLV